MLDNKIVFKLVVGLEWGIAHSESLASWLAAMLETTDAYGSTPGGKVLHEFCSKALLQDIEEFW